MCKNVNFCARQEHTFFLYETLPANNTKTTNFFKMKPKQKVFYTYFLSKSYKKFRPMSGFYKLSRFKVYYIRWLEREGRCVQLEIAFTKTYLCIGLGMNAKKKQAQMVNRKSKGPFFVVYSQNLWLEKCQNCPKNRQTFEAGYRKQCCVMNMFCNVRS